MNRRLFLRRALTGVAVAVVASQIPSKLLMDVATSQPETIGGYVDYCNFSQMALTDSMEKIIQESAVELGYRAGVSINELYAATFDSYEPVAFGRMA